MPDPSLLDPSLKAVVDSLAQSEVAPIESLPVDESREAFLAMALIAGPGEECGGVEDLLIAGVPCRIFRPLDSSIDSPIDSPNDSPTDTDTDTHAGAETRALLPILVWFHGGGWVLGNLDSTDATARSLANKLGQLVVLVDYRLAPESRFPAAAEDSFAVTSWLASEQAASLGGDPSHLSVGGDSAGGNLAAVVSLLCRDAGIAVKQQILIYPITDVSKESDSYVENATGYLLTADLMRWFINSYTSPDQRLDWRVSPLLAEDLSGLAPAFILTAGFDPLRDEGLAYAERLLAAGVAVTHRHFPGAIHSFFSLGGLTELAAEAMDQVAAATAVISQGRS
ncbi:MAG: alpha/beta hydrolase [Microthrixaceae bacterium]